MNPGILDILMPERALLVAAACVMCMFPIAVSIPEIIPVALGAAIAFRNFWVFRSAFDKKAMKGMPGT